MSTTKAYTVYSAECAGTNIGQIVNHRESDGIAQIIMMANGQNIPGFAATVKHAPTIDFTTTDLAAALANGANGWAISGSGGNTAKFWLQKYTNLGALDAGSTAIKLTMTKGLILPRRLSANQNAAATIDLQAVPVYDGTNDPIIFADNQALGTNGLTTGVAFVAGPIKIGSTIIEGIKSIDIDFGIGEELQSSSGEPFNTMGYLPAINPSITITTTDMSQLASLAATGSINSITLYLKKLAEATPRVADATASHIKLYAAKAKITRPDGSASQSGAGTLTLQFWPIYDGTNSIFTINTASAIT